MARREAKTCLSDYNIKETILEAMLFGTCD